MKIFHEWLIINTIYIYIIIMDLSGIAVLELKAIQVNEHRNRTLTYN